MRWNFVQLFQTLIHIAVSLTSHIHTLHKVFRLPTTLSEAPNLFYVRKVVLIKRDRSKGAVL